MGKPLSVIYRSLTPYTLSRQFQIIVFIIAIQKYLSNISFCVRKPVQETGIFWRNVFIICDLLPVIMPWIIEVCLARIITVICICKTCRHFNTYWSFSLILLYRNLCQVFKCRQNQRRTAAAAKSQANEEL